MAAQLERMKKKRKTIRSSATKLLTNLEEEIKNEEPDCDKLRELLSMLSVKEESLVELDRGIENETSTDDLEGEIASALEYQDRIIMWKSRAKSLLERRLEQESERIKSPANHERLPEKRKKTNISATKGCGLRVQLLKLD
ncbi:mitogen-activated kinase 4-like isoform X2 [Labeo rohita]|uniref:Mitogen-activated kinase 4-like isoform X2 n=1 Tax=Labeo rohita TaxID=84645 RepID=A0A498ML52_LABRO|nr:mitogen-activated kinase 4-like isoform X2 [Labeo rohita]